jgi:hypothetical protein
LNRLGEGGGFQDLPRFQRLVAEGVEDAIVSAFNQMDVIPDELAEAQPGGALEHLPAEAIESYPVEAIESQPTEIIESQPAEIFESPPADALESPPADALELRPAETTHSSPDPTTETVVGQPSVRLDRSVLSRPPLVAENPVGPPASSARFDRLTATHYGGTLHGEAFFQRYANVRFVDSGWIVGSFGTRPITEPGFLILWLRDEPGVVEVWRNRVPVYEGCRYEEFFEDI